jgi:SpoIIAA-like
MLELLPAQDHVAAFRFENTITADDYARVRGEIEARLARHARVGVYADVTQCRGISPRALLRDLQFGFAKRHQIDRFARSALVTDQAWLRRIVDFSAYFLPAIEVRVFAPDEHPSALEWAARLPVVGSRPPALAFIETTRSDTFAFEWKGRLTRADIERAIETLRPAFESNASVRLLARIEDMGGVAPDALLQSGLFSLKLLGLRKLQRYAVVGGPSWLTRYIQVLRGVLARDIRHFTRDREREAWSWLEAQPRQAESVHA